MKNDGVDYGGKQAFSIAEACEILGIGRSTLGKLLKNGDLQLIRAGEKRILIPKWSIEAFLKNLK